MTVSLGRSIYHLMYSAVIMHGQAPLLQNAVTALVSLKLSELKYTSQYAGNFHGITFDIKGQIGNISGF